MSNSVSSSVNQKLSENVIMQMVFADLRVNRPKSFDGCDLNSMPVHRRYNNMSLPNMAVWKSMPILPAVDDIQSKQKPSEIRVLPNSANLPVYERAVSCPNMAMWKSMPILPAVDDIQSKQKPSEIRVLPNSANLPVYERAVSCPNMALLKSPAPAAAPVQDSGIETSLFLVSPSSLRLQKLEDDMLPMLTDTVGRSDEGTVPALTSDTPRRPRRSLWSRTKKFVRRMFCCGAVDQADI